MNTFFIEYRDPLFSIIMFFVLIFVITFVSYWWGRYKRKEDYRHLDKFLKQFHTLPSENELKVLIQNSELSEKSWLLLADAYFKNGDFEKSIEIYNEILQSGDKSNYKQTLFLLGKTYFKAGFLQRAKEIFLEILRKSPRTPQALHYLFLVYEHLREYDKASEVLEPLDELNQDITSQSAYIQIISIINDMKASVDEKGKNLLEVYNKTHKHPHMVFEYLFKTNPKLAWQNFDSSQSEMLTDILWQVDKKDLDLDIISKNAYLRELYTARGDVDMVDSSSVFEFDVLINLKQNANATLSFEYICDSCKMLSPFAFSKCNNCHAIRSSKIELSLVRDFKRDFSEEYNSFQ